MPLMRSKLARTARLLPLLALVVGALLLSGCRAQGVFRSDQDPVQTGAMTRRAVQVTLQQLDEAPGDYLNRFIRVRGDFTRLPETTCEKVRGPALGWALSNGQLRLDALGFGSILRLVPDGTSMTVDGFWRAYHRPGDCGQQAEADVVWYLEAVRLVEPNPLPAIGAVTTDASEEEEQVESAAPETEGTRTPTATPSTRTPTVTGTSPPTATQPTPTPTADTSATPTGTPSPTATTEPGQPTNTPQPSDTPEPSPTTASGATPTSSAPTSTPGGSGYPGDPPTPAPSPTPGY